MAQDWIINHLAAECSPDLGCPAFQKPAPRACPQGRGSSLTGLLPAGTRPLRDRRLQGRMASPPGLVLQPQGQPQDKAEVGVQMFTVLVEELDGTARAELWPKLVAEAPSVGEF
jgi:hypothetical protein